MEPRQITEQDLVTWGDLNPRAVTYAADDQHCYPCPALRVDDPDRPGGVMIVVPYILNEIELMNLAKGSPLWLICVGMLPIHSLTTEDRNV